ncbi:MAG: HlyD family type I secretion periplasmic adaptor subunit [Rhodospirillaceae bacterium]|jgi:membrane fusion protein, adhesin transport system|nr:HlyD family type I secretion periplasmic adaptor subunit [Rhodospirillaceae bacterium]MBT6203766.1 HlyD family type I secretion periplasmic adaptor subunit [Rhodospirillaceae bacterium]MBT7646964.1 HlyD family type I secretion periplasmic adaptor subunit [Rhodospirillaceae bacterium]
MSELDDLQKQTKASAIRFFGWAIMVLLIILGAWASQAELDEVATATGEFVPQGQVKTIQHLEGGIIEEMFVNQGDRVVAGSPLVRLDLNASQGREAELQVTLDGLMLRRARLLAEAHGGSPDFPEDVLERRTQMAQNEINSLNARRAEMESAALSAEEQVRQRESDLRQLEEEAGALRSQLALAREAFYMAEDLITDGLISLQDHLARKIAVDQIQGQLATVEASLPGADSALAEAKERMREAELAFERNALEELANVEIQIDTIAEEIIKATSISRRTLIMSPIDGIVKSLRFFTIGAVVRPGEAIMDIVPSDDQLVVEARLNPQDIGYVRVGQAATVKVSTYDYIRYGGLEAEVILVSPDSQQDESGNTYFRVVATTDGSYLGSEPGEYPVTAGMEATLDIHTGSNSVLDYLLKPVLKLRHEALRER